MSGSPLDPLRGEPRLLLAVSGGPDSIALLGMATDWAAGSPALFAATVDHGLRPEAAAEADAVGALCARLGVPHAVLRWEGDKPSAGVQERAREARYALISAHARTIDARVIVTAHHLDDQAETVLLRLTRGSGLAGLAGMAARTRRGEVEVARPLLGLPKSDLVAFCNARGLPYVWDPSNANHRFARSRLRSLAATLAEEGLDAPSLARLARRAATVEAALQAQTDVAEARLRVVATGRCDAAALAQLPEEIVRRLLTLAVARAAGADPARVPLDAMERLAADFVAAASARGRFAGNVAGALVSCERGEASVAREPPRRTASAKPA